MSAWIWNVGRGIGIGSFVCVVIVNVVACMGGELWVGWWVLRGETCCKVEGVVVCMCAMGSSRGGGDRVKVAGI